MAHHTLFFANMILIFFSEELNATGDRTGCSITEGAEGLATDVVADVHQQVDIALLAMPMLKAVENLG